MLKKSITNLMNKKKLMFQKLKVKIFFTLIISILLIYSCDTTRRMRNNTNTLNNELVEKISQNSLQYNNLSAKFSAEFTSAGKSMSVSGMMRLRRDTLIWVSIMPLAGIEMVRLQLTNDSVYMMNRLNKTYTINDFSYFKKNFGLELNYKDIQNLITNSLLVFPIETNLLNYVTETDTAGITLSSHTETQLQQSGSEIGISQKIKIDATNFRTKYNQITDHQNQQKALITYSAFETTENKLFPMNIVIDVVSRGNVFKLGLIFKKITYDTNMETPFEISARYKRLEK